MVRLAELTKRLWILLLFAAIPVGAQTHVRHEDGGRWGPWTTWSACSRSCGVGLAYRIRHCHAVGNFSHVPSACTGHDRQHQVCNRQACPGGEEDYRSKECRKHNQQFYGGRRYQWEAFINPYARCELACKALQHRYYARFQTTVQDGTRCKPDAEAYCINGECLDVGCDGVLGSGAVVDQCGVCGGNGVTCRVISGIFTRVVLEHHDYHHVITLPVGACNINITELAPSRNYLALTTARGSVLNGDHQLRHVGQYPGAGTVFDYRRRSGHYCPGACIFADGPTTEVVEVKLLSFDRNPGVLYQFTVPHDTAASVMGAAGNTSHHRRDSGHDYNHLPSRREQQQHRQQLSGNSEGLEEKRSAHARTQNQQDRKHSTTNAKPPTETASDSRTADEDLSAMSLGDSPSPARDGTFHSRGVHKIPAGDPRTKVVPSSSAGEFQKGEDEVSQQRDASVRRAQVANTPYFLPEDDNTPVEYRHYYHIDSEDYRKLQQRRYYSALTTDVEPRDNRLDSRAKRPPGAEVLQRPNIIPATRDAVRTVWGTETRSRGHSNVLNNDLGDIPLTVPASGDFAWTISGFSECSEPCGGGFQQTVVVCIKQDTRVIVIEENCNINTKPTSTSVECNKHPCHARWTAMEWSACSVTCGHGVQSRTVECKQRMSPTLQLSVSADQCRDAKPPVSQFCRQPDCFQWRASNWTKCSADCGLGERTRSILCVDGDGKNVAPHHCRQQRPAATELCDMGSCAKGWYHTKWSKKCTPECGEGYKTRQVYCAADDGSLLPSGRCAVDQKPSVRRACADVKPCGGKWFTGPWSQCNATCGEGWRMRDVVCVKRHGQQLLSVVGKENCLRKERPLTRERCLGLPPCPSEWYMTTWTQCSQSCGTGTKTREVRCLNATLLPSEECSAAQRPSQRRPCNRHPCHALHPADNDYDIGPPPQPPLHQHRHLQRQQTVSGPVNVTDDHFYDSHARPLMALQAAAPSEIRVGANLRSAMGDLEPHSSYGVQGRHVQANNNGHQHQRPLHTKDVADENKEPSAQGREEGEEEESGGVGEEAEGEDASCVDKPNSRWCLLVSQARMCRYPHYKNQCCRTCRKYFH